MTKVLAPCPKHGDNQEVKRMYLGIDQNDGKMFFDLEFECCGSIIRARTANAMEKIPKTVEQRIQESDPSYAGVEPPNEI